MLLSEIWFLLIAVLFVGFMFLEGFDFGVGMGTKFLARNDSEKRILNDTIGPFWDANEVWLITAGGAMFAAFPHWYATLFSGYYIPFVILLLALIGRGVAFEFRNRAPHKKWVQTWDWAIFIGSILPPFLVGVLFTSLIKGLPVQSDMNMYLGFTDVVNPYTIVGGVSFVVLSYLHGLTFITLKTTDSIRKRAMDQARKVYIAAGICLAFFIGLTAVYTEVFAQKTNITIAMFAAIVVVYLALLPLLIKRKEGLSFTATGLIIIVVTAFFFVALFPNVMISSLDPAYHITLYKAASGDYSLKVMTIVAFTLVPVVLAYTVWSYYVFRKRVTGEKTTDG